MASNDDIRLKMTVSKMNVHRSTKLETIAVKCIARNLDSFLNPKNSKTRHIKLLPIGLRNIVFQQWLMKHFAELHKPQYDYLSKKNYNKFFEKTMKIFQTLVSCHTLNVDFTPFTKNIYNSLAREQRFKYLDVIGAKATNLKELTLSNCYPYVDDEQQNITLCNVIGKLRNLESLNIGDIHVKYTNLKAMCRNLEHLTHLSTRIIFDPRFDESNESDIEDLQIFSNLIFFDHGSFDEKFTLNCIQHLPKLQCVGRLGFPVVLNTSMIDELLDRCPNQKFALKNLALSARSNKEIHLSFPNVTNLQIDYFRMGRDDVIIPNSLKFSKIENLTLSLAYTTDKLIPFLDAYGHGLYSLTIKYCRDRFKLSSILDRCPKLQSLSLQCVFILRECSRPDDIHSFSTGLKEFEMLHQWYDDNNAILLLDILSVPTLECVTLRMRCERFHLVDIAKLTAMVASRQILGNLKRLKIFVDNMERDYNHLVFYTLNDFIKSASAFLPHLTEIKTDILSNVQVGTSSGASLQVATLKTFIDVYEN